MQHLEVIYNYYVNYDPNVGDHLVARVIQTTAANSIESVGTLQILHSPDITNHIALKEYGNAIARAINQASVAMGKVR